MMLSNNIRSVPNESKYNENDKVLWVMPIRFWELENKPIMMVVDEIGSNGVYGYAKEEYGEDRVWFSNDNVWYSKDKCRMAQYGMAQVFEARQGDHLDRVIDITIEKARAKRKNNNDRKGK